MILGKKIKVICTNSTLVSINKGKIGDWEMETLASRSPLELKSMWLPKAGSYMLLFIASERSQKVVEKHSLRIIEVWAFYSQQENMVNILIQLHLGHV